MTNQVENDQLVPVTLLMSANEYGEVLAKLANQLEIYCNPDGGSDATDNFKRAFAKLDAACPFPEAEIYQTTLMRKFRSQLADFYPDKVLN